MFRRFAGLLLGLCVVGLAVPGAWAVAASPSNDNFANAQAISAGSVVPGTLVDASAEAGEPAHAGSAASNSVWYRWTAAETGRVGLRTCVGPATAVTRKAVYVGTSIDSLELVADDSYTPYCYMTFVADAGETYEIAIDARGPAGTFNLELNTYLPRPPNDDFADAEVIPSSTSPGPVAGTSYGATWEVGEPDLFFDLPAEASVWYRWTAPATGTVEIDNCSPSGDPVMAAYEGDQLEELDQLDANDDGCDYGSTINDLYVGSILVFDVVKGHQYRIAVDNLWENDTTDPLSHFTLYFGMDVEPPPSQGYLGSPPPPGFVTPPAVTPKKKRCKKHRGATSAKKRRCKKRKKH